MLRGDWQLSNGIYPSQWMSGFSRLTLHHIAHHLTINVKRYIRLVCLNDEVMKMTDGDIGIGWLENEY